MKVMNLPTLVILACCLSFLHTSNAEMIEQDESMMNQIGKETMVSKRVKIPKKAGLTGIATVGVSALGDVLERIGNIPRKIAIGIDNETPYTWEAPDVYFSSGTSDEKPQFKVSSKESVVYTARKSSGGFRGVVGVLVYVIPGDQKISLAVMFSVPYDYNLYSNWWDVKAFSGVKKANKQLYYDMYNGSPYKADNNWHNKNLGFGLRMEKGFMTDVGEASLVMEIIKTK